MPGHNVAARRRKQHRLKQQAAAENAAITEWLHKYDVSKTGTLKKDEMKNLLTEVKREATKDPNAVVKEESTLAPSRPPQVGAPQG